MLQNALPPLHPGPHSTGVQSHFKSNSHTTKCSPSPTPSASYIAQGRRLTARVTVILQSALPPLHPVPHSTGRRLTPKVTAILQNAFPTLYPVPLPHQ